MGKIIIFVFLALVVIALAPLVTIWAINTLFATQIAFTIETWLATFWLTAILTASAASRK